MKKNLLGATFFFFSILFSAFGAHARQGDSGKDTVYTGIYITSIHDIDFKQKEYSINFWLWLRYKNKNFDFWQYLEVPSAKSVDKLFLTVDSSGNGIYMLMKLQCVMKDSWRINNFPFDVQKLWLSIENSQYDADSLVFVPDLAGRQYDPRFALRGWNIDSCVVTARNKVYETAFGDPKYKSPHAEYSAFRVRLSISRNAGGLFWKMFLGMYIAFLIAFSVFFIHADGMDSRFGLTVGSIFAVIGNKYIIDSSLPESTSFTLVDTLHGITLLFILVIIGANAYFLKLIKSNLAPKALKFDSITYKVILFLYIILNAWFIWRAQVAA